MEPLTPLLNLGAVGAVLAWVLWRLEPRLERSDQAMAARFERIEQALDRLTRAQLLMLISQPAVEEPVRQQAHQILEEMNGHDAAEPRPKGRR